MNRIQLHSEKHRSGSNISACRVVGGLREELRGGLTQPILGDGVVRKVSGQLLKSILKDEEVSHSGKG